MDQDVVHELRLELDIYPAMLEMLNPSRNTIVPPLKETQNCPVTPGP